MKKVIGLMIVIVSFSLISASWIWPKHKSSNSSVSTYKKETCANKFSIENNNVSLCIPDGYGSVPDEHITQIPNLESQTAFAKNDAIQCAKDEQSYCYVSYINIGIGNQPILEEMGTYIHGENDYQPKEDGEFTTESGKTFERIIFPYVFDSQTLYPYKLDNGKYFYIWHYKSHPKAKGIDENLIQSILNSITQD